MTTRFETREELMALVDRLAHQPPHHYSKYEILCIVLDRLTTHQKRQDSQTAIVGLGRAIQLVHAELTRVEDALFATRFGKLRRTGR